MRKVNVQPKEPSIRFQQRSAYLEAPFYKILEKRLVSCQDERGRLNLQELGRRMGYTRQHMHIQFAKGELSPQIAYYLLETFDDELSSTDIRPYVRRQY